MQNNQLNEAQPLTEEMSQVACISKCPNFRIFEVDSNLQVKYSIRDWHIYCNLTMCDVTCCAVFDVSVFFWLTLTYFQQTYQLMPKY